MTILIKNIQLIDGTGRPPAKADVLVKNEKISAIGSFPRYKADEIIDGLGSYLAPGFIDIDTDSDHYLTIFSNPGQKDFSLQGVTTIIGGQCGISLAPIFYGSLDSLRERADTSKINVNWRTMAEFLEAMDRRPLGVNFGTFAGHATIRRDLAGDTSRNLSKNELHVFDSVLKKALKEGAFGFSTGLGYGNNRQTSCSEIKFLAETTAKAKGVYATHLRNEKGGLLSSVNETIEIAKETGVKVLISHFRPLIGWEKDYEEALELIDRNADKADVHFDIYPFGASTVLVSHFLPDWAQENDREVMMKDIQSPGFREKILRDMPRLNGEKIIIVSSPGNEYFIGKTLKEFSENRNLSIYEGLLDLMKISDFRAAVSYENINLKRTIKTLANNRAIVASNSASFKESEGIKKTSRPERSYRTFTRFLELAEKENILPLETAIHKITGLPAQKLGLDRRGLVKDGYFADLVIFKGAEVREVILNGKLIVKSGKFQDKLAGKILRHNR